MGFVVCEVNHLGLNAATKEVIEVFGSSRDVNYVFAFLA